MKLVNRSALILKPKTPFWEWLNSIEPLESDDLLENDPEVYLIPDLEETEEIEEWLKINFDLFFTEQLNDWYVDERLWVQNRTFQMFKDWFDISTHTMVFDVVGRK